VYKCYACRKPFTVKVETIFEDSHIAMRDVSRRVYFRFNNRASLGVDDEMRGTKALKGVVGKRLTYRRIGEHA
jgi:hypothetical protein